MKDATKMMTPAGIVAIPNEEVVAREHRGCFKGDNQGKPFSEKPEKVVAKKPTKGK